MSAHFFRTGIPGMALVWLILPLLLLIRRRWIARVFQVLMIVAAAVWVRTAVDLAAIRDSAGAPWIRLAIILGSVALLTLLSAFILEKRALKNRYTKRSGYDTAMAWAFLLTVGLLAIARNMVEMQMLIVDRFFPTFGWVEILLLALYASWIAEKILDPALSAKWRYRIWIFFSTVFFTQLIIGLFGVEGFLMTGKLHLPIPTMILAGPIYRGHGFFMPILFTATVLLAGPAWCSYFCYIGAWDNIAANAKKRPESLPGWRHPARIAILLLVIAAALLMRSMGVPPLTAVIAGAIFGIAGVGIMAWFSRKTGTMAHCITWCPMGLLADLIGRINPFSMRIEQACTSCGACATVCRYDALTPMDIQKKKVGFTCTLCGDCVSSCSGGWINYRLFGMKPEKARTMFIVLVVTLHATLLGLARI